MARVTPDQPLVPSVLDRLLDDEPRVAPEPTRSRGQILSEMKKSLRRDLQNLLNTRWRNRQLPPELKELERSLVNYGLPDFNGADIATSEKRKELCRRLQSVIRTFHSTIQSVAVTLRGDDNPLDGTIHFQIDALLRVHPAPEQVTLDPSLELDTGNFKFKEPAR